MEIEQNGARRARRLTLAVCVLCAPCILATAGLWPTAYVAVDTGTATPGWQTLLGSMAPWLFLIAAYSSVLLVGAGPLAVRVTRSRGVAVQAIITVWVVLVLALIAVRVFYRDLIWKLEMP